MGGISIWQLAILVLIIVLLFGTKKLRTLGTDLGESVKGFKKAMNEENKPEDATFSKVEQNAQPEQEKIKKKNRFNPCLILAFPKSY
ncbi:twin-arginine translocation protein, TatA/E family subunit [Aggregatibacter actinomycetemcomitans NUM4039]|nr:Sec-independent protein translocase subunit TatA [Aggregatibacter actinomycetemcomitans]BAS47676.1 twin-arginine translocation protein, TatA/E family subunit [Aggregatibacter actinomycetemcomitans NUM4039]